MSSSSSNRNWKHCWPRSDPDTPPFSNHFLGRAEMRAPIGCSLGLTALPMRVRAFSMISQEVSISGALMRILVGAVCVWATALPFSAVVNLYGAIYVCVEELVSSTSGSNELSKVWFQEQRSKKRVSNRPPFTVQRSLCRLWRYLLDQWVEGRLPLRLSIARDGGSLVDR